MAESAHRVYTKFRWRQTPDAYRMHSKYVRQLSFVNGSETKVVRLSFTLYKTFIDEGEMQPG